MTRPLLGAAMIVRDEEERLPACLASLQGVVDEIVVADTGSVDATMDLARAAGARVYQQPWTGSFADARNAVLDRVKARWVLSIDADERLRPTCRDEVEALMGGKDVVGFRVLLHVRAGYTPYREYRLWRHDERIRYAGLIHERIGSAIDAIAAAEGLRTLDCDLGLDHVGYDGDQTAKHRRDLPLLRAQLEIEPANTYNWRHLGKVLRHLGDLAGAEDAYERAVELTRAAASDQLPASAAFADLAAFRLAIGGDATDLLEEALARWPANWTLVSFHARQLAGAGRFDEALALFDQLAGVDIAALPETGLAYDVRLFRVVANSGRGLCLFRMGRFAEAAEAYRVVEVSDPHNQEHRLKRIVAECRARDAAATQPSPGSTRPSPTS